VPEWDLLVACCKTGVDLNELLRGEASRSTELSFDELIRLAVWHGMAPLLASRLEPFADRFTACANARLQQLRRQAIFQNLRLSMSLLQALRALEECNIPSIPFKGPLLSERLYGDLGLRQSSDIDLIVRPEDLHSSLAVLRTVGFETAYTMRPERVAALLVADFEVTLVRDGLQLDLHWDIMPSFYGVEFGLGDAWQRARRTEASGTQILEFAPEDHFIALALHASKHFWSKLIWLSDLWQLLYMNPTFNWDILLKRARAMRVERMMLITLALLKDLVGVPPGIASHASEDFSSSAQNSNWQAAYQMALNNLCSPDPEIEGLRTYYFFLRVRDRKRDAVRQVLRHATTPASAELSLTERPLASPVYLVLHMSRLAIKILVLVCRAGATRMKRIAGK
jgi:hypothetical protein